jgi:hypothetical protein
MVDRFLTGSKQNGEIKKPNSTTSKKINQRLLKRIGVFEAKDNMTYGECENVEVSSKKNLLPIGIAEGCRLTRDIPKDQTLTYDDVILPEGRLIENCEWNRLLISKESWTQ